MLPVRKWTRKGQKAHRRFRIASTCSGIVWFDWFNVFRRIILIGCDNDRFLDSNSRAQLQNGVQAEVTNERMRDSLLNFTIQQGDP